MALWAHLPMGSIVSGSVLDVSGLGHDFDVVQYNGGLAGPSVVGAAPSGDGSLLFGPHALADTGPNQPAHGLVSQDSIGSWSSWMMEAWIRPATAPPAGHGYSIVQNRPGSNVWFWLDATMKLWTWSGAGSVVSSGTIPVGVWTHVALSRDTFGMGHFWIGGAQDATPIPSALALGSAGFTVGVDTSDVGIVNFCDKVFDGRIAGVKLWDSYAVPVVGGPAGWSIGVIG